MAEHQLPDDMGRWPDDPFRLLGVRQGDDERAVRQAYLRLVRTYKPDHYPEQFRRLRNAYETILAQLQAASQFEAWQQRNSPQSPASEAIEIPPEAAGSPVRPPRRPDAPQDASSQCERLWRRAVDGDLAGAYKKLLALHCRHQGDYNLCVRLYWLLKLDGSLDSQRKPCDHLACGLAAARLTGPLLELYCREIQQCPAEGVSPRADDLMDQPAPVAALVDLSEARWPAAFRLQHYDAIVRDLDRLRARRGMDDLVAWGRTLYSALNYLSWADDRANQEAAQALFEEVDALPKLHPELIDAIDRLDLLQETVSQWRMMRSDGSVLGAWRNMVPLAWNFHWRQLGQPLEELSVQIAQQPREALIRIDRMWRSFPLAAMQFGGLFEAAWREVRQWDSPDGDVDAQTGPCVRDFLLLRSDRAYPRVRGGLLDLCLRESLEPDAVAELADRFAPPPADGQSWAERVATDGPLRSVYAATRYVLG